MKRWFIVIFLAALFVSAPLAAASYKGDQSGPALMLDDTSLERVKTTSPRFQDRTSLQFYYLDKRSGHFYWDDGSLKIDPPDTHS